MKSHDKKDWLKLTVVAVVAIVLAGLGTIIASNVAPASSPVGPVAIDATISTIAPNVSTTTVPPPLAVATEIPSLSTTSIPAAPAAIEVSETIIDFGDNASTVSLELTNTGGTIGAWTVRSSDPEVSVSPSDGELGPGEVAKIAATLDRGVVAEGEFGATLTLVWGDQKVQLFVQAVHADNPVIIAPKSSPSTVVAQTGAGCDPSKTTITVRVKDRSEIADVIVRWSNGVSVVETPMAAVDVENYKAVIGPFVEVVSPNVKIVATDVHENAGGAPVSLSVIACP